MAVFSLIYGLLAVPGIGTLFAALAVIFGHVGLWKCKSTPAHPQPMRGRRAAQIGLLLGYLSLAATPLLYLAGGIYGWDKKDELFQMYDQQFLEQRMDRSYDSAARLYLACETFAPNNYDQYPATWNQLIGRYLTSNDLRRLLKSSHPGGKTESFRMIRHERPIPLELLESTIVIQEIAPPNVPEVIVVYADGNAGLIDNPALDDSEKM